MRTFVALDITEEKVLDSLVSFQQELSATGADVKLVERQNLHFTLRFLGEISEAEAAEAKKRLESLHLVRQSTKLQGIGAFPSSARPNVVWVGVADEDKVNLIAGPVIRVLGDIGQRDSRPFRAHLTLARVRSGRNGPELESFLRTVARRQFGDVDFSTVRLKLSNLTPAGPVYNDLGVYSLG